MSLFKKFESPKWMLMGRFTKIAFLSFVMACRVSPEEVPIPNDDLDDVGKLLTGTWQYDRITVGSDDFFYANARMELTIEPDTAGGNRADLFRRKITYYNDRSYQIKWSERGDYALGTFGDPNWQPSFGYWDIENNQLVHNRGQYYETRYDLELSETRLSRSSDRYMSESLFGAQWQVGEIIRQSELFVLEKR